MSGVNKKINKIEHGHLLDFFISLKKKNCKFVDVFSDNKNISITSRHRAIDEINSSDQFI